VPGTLIAGDTVLIRGGVYREKLNLLWLSGNASNPITIKNYDSEDVIIDASTEITSWTHVSDNIYSAVPGFDVSYVVLDDIVLRPAVTQTNGSAGYTDNTAYAGITMQAGQFYQDNSTGILYVWTPDGASPNSHTIGVVGYRDSYAGDAIRMWDVNYLVFENLTIRFANSYGITAMGDANSFGHIVYNNLKIIFNGHTGIGTGPSAQLTNSEVGWNMMGNWPRGRYNGGTQGGGWGAGVNIGSDSLAENNTIHHNGGEGMLTYMNTGNTIFKNNTVYDNWSMNLYVDTAPNVLVDGNLVYCNEPNLADAENNGFPADGTIIKGLRPIGIGTADEYYGGPHTNYLHDVTIKNNLIVNCRRGYNHYAQYVGSGMKNVKILNNTIITPATTAGVDPGSADNFLGVYLTYNGGNNSGVEVKNNIVVARNQANYALYGVTGGVDTFDAYTINNNLWYNTSYAKPIHWGINYPISYDYNLADWQSLSGTAHGQGDISLNPLFANLGSFDALDYFPTVASPFVDAGAILPEVDVDYFGSVRPQGSAYDMGALEYIFGGDAVAPSAPSGLSVL
jgi:hypothetical protein